MSVTPEAMRAHLEATARRECAAVLKIIRESYRPSEPIEAIVIAAFAHGAGWAFNLEAELATADRKERLAERWS